MILCIRNRKPARKEVQRIAVELVDDSLARMAASLEEAGDAVHRARKNIKKLRAMLRLLKKEMSPRIYERENKCLRDIGRKLSAVRDAQVRLKTFSALKRKPGTRLSHSLQSHFRKERDEGYRKLCRRASLRGVVSALRSVRGRVQKWPLKDLEKPDFKKDLRRLYKRSRQDFHAAKKNQVLPNLHESRKRAKDLWYALCLLKGRGPRPVRQAADEMKEFTEKLGTALDLGLLEDALDQKKKTIRSKAGLEELQVAIECERRDRQEKAFKIGRKFFRKSPRAFVKKW